MRYVTEVGAENKDPIDLLGELDYMFAISEIDPKIGRIEITQASWPSEGNKTYEPIPVLPCMEVLKDDDPMLNAI